MVHEEEEEEDHKLILHVLKSLAALQSQVEVKTHDTVKSQITVHNTWWRVQGGITSINAPMTKVPRAISLE